MKTAIVVDCETTGLTLPPAAPLDKQPHIIELGCAVVRNNEIVSQHSWLINPGAGIELESKITKITGIKNEDLVGKPLFADVLQEIRNTFSPASVFIAHNAPFDKSCIEYELQRLQCEDFPWPAETLCTVQEFRHLFGRRAKLTELYQRLLNKELQQSHRALDDVLALCEIVIKEKLA